MSTISKAGDPTPADWKAAGLRYYAYNFYLRNRFGGRVQKVSIDAGFTCPNVDGTLAKGGCVFCSNTSFSPSRRVRRQQILDQIDDGIRRLKTRYDCDMFMAYFQPGTNTYASVEVLEPLFQAAVEHEKVVALAIGTRPDCVPQDVLEMIDRLASLRPVSLELGMQTMHDASLIWMNRAHDHRATVDAVERCRARNFEVCLHVMLGLPGESPAQMLATAEDVARFNVHSVKIHHLYAVRNTPMGEEYLNGGVQLMERDEYIRVLLDFLEVLPPTCVVERLIGDAPPKYLLGPAWCLDKPAFKQAFESEAKRRDTWQGKRYKPSGAAVQNIMSE